MLQESSTEDRLQRVKGIMDTYQSNFTDKMARLGKSWDEFKESWGVGRTPSKQDLKELSEFTIWKQNAIQDVTKEIHAFAGGNMTKHEIDQTIPLRYYRNL